MDIEQLSKSQIVLLTLLVSFMTSIATGIVTVSLMDQAPPAIAQTVNRVIERTVETVAPAKQNQAAASVVTQEKTVVVKEQNLISQAVERISPSIVRVFTTSQESPVFLGMGFVLDSSGTIVTDIAALDDRAEAMITLSDGTSVRAFVTKRDKDLGIAFLSATTSERTPRYVPVTFAMARPVLGETIVALAGKTVPRIANGLVTALPPATENSAPMIDTDIASESIIAGSIIINTEGNVVGVSTGVSRTSSRSVFIASTALIAPTVANTKQR